MGTFELVARCLLMVAMVALGVIFVVANANYNPEEERDDVEM